MRLDYKYKLKENIIPIIPNFEKKLITVEINKTTIKNLIKGGNTTKVVAEKICAALRIPVKKVFDIVEQEKKLSSATIHHYHRLIRTMLTTAVQWQLIMSNPAERVKPPKTTKKEAQFYDIDEVNQMLELLENEPLKYKVMIHIVIFCGLRRGELTNLEWVDVDFEEDMITISKQLQYLPEFGVYEIKSAKTDSGNRTISIPSSLTDLLREYKEWQDAEKVKWGDKWVETNKLFTKENGEPIFPETPSKWFNKFIKKHNLPPLTFHQLRHTNASLLISQNVDIATVSNRLGYADKAITLRIYTHAIKEKDREAADKLQNLIKKKKK